MQSQVEATLSVSPYVDNIMVHADPSQNYCVALVVAAASELENWASKQSLTYADTSDLCQKQEAVREVLQSLTKVRAFTAF
jgi:long-chain acyl-CoA synthetase